MALAFSQSRFVATVGDVFFGCTRIKNIPLGLLLERYHAEQQPLLHTMFRGQSEMDVWLVNGTAALVRHFRFHFSAVLPLPLDLHSEMEGRDPPALDRVLLRNALLVLCEDIPLDQSPDAVRTLKRRDTLPYAAR